MKKKPLKEFEKIANICFKNKDLLTLALTHSSSNRKKNKKVQYTADNERLEFLGDAVLKLVISDFLYDTFPTQNEGDLTKFRAYIVSDKFLALLAKDLDIGDYLKLSAGEEKSGGQTRPSNLANAFEALLGAYYLDSGLTKTKKFLLTLIKKYTDNWKNTKQIRDHKTKLQEIQQKNKEALPLYSILKEDGPEHKKIFKIEVKIDIKDKTYTAIGKGATKKYAEQNAAKQLISKLKK